MAKLSNDILRILETVSENINIIVITDRFNVFEPEIYSVIDYRLPTKETPEISLIGYRRITELFNEKSGSYNSYTPVATIMTSISTMEIKRQERKFDSNQFSYLKL